MQTGKRLPIALLALRLSIFLVMLVWTLDKLFAPGHASAVFGKLSPGVESSRLAFSWRSILS